MKSIKAFGYDLGHKETFLLLSLNKVISFPLLTHPTTVYKDIGLYAENKLRFGEPLQYSHLKVCKNKKYAGNFQ